MEVTISREHLERLIAEATADGAKHRAKAEEFLSEGKYTSFHWHSGAAFYAEKIADNLQIALEVTEQYAPSLLTLAQ